MRFLSLLCLPFFHKNGVAQQAQIEILEPKVSDTRPQKDERSQLIKGLEEVEEFVLADLGVVDARVSVKTNAERERFIQILVCPTDRYKHKDRFQKLKRRLTREVSVRLGIPQPHVQVKKMRTPPITESF